MVRSPPAGPQITHSAVPMLGSSATAASPRPSSTSSTRQTAAFDEAAGASPQVSVTQA